MESKALPRQLLDALKPGEEVRLHARSTGAVLAVTTERVVVAEPDRIALVVPFEGVRRIQFDIERTRPATLVIVPERAEHDAQVLAIPPRQYEAAAAAIVAIGQTLAGLGRS